MYEERTYRRVSRPQDLVCYEVVRKETDLFCCTSLDLKAFIEGRALFYRNQLETYIRERPEFLKSLRPVRAGPTRAEDGERDGGGVSRPRGRAYGVCGGSGCRIHREGYRPPVG